MKCSILGCQNEVSIENDLEICFQCCSMHINEVKDYFEEQYNREQQEMYDWWLGIK